MFLINIPHASTYIPKEYQKDYIISETELIDNTFKFADLYTDFLYKGLFDKNEVLKAKYSRLFIDMERFEDDNLEEQYKHGMGWYYTKSPFVDKIIRTEESKNIIINLYHEYHNELTNITSDILEQDGIARIIDCHSFSSTTLRFQPSDIQKPEICLGFEDYHKDAEFIETFIEEFKDYDVSFNKPYAGSIVPLQFYKKDKRVFSTMIEINKKLYMDEITFEKKEAEYFKLQEHFYNLNTKIRL